MDGLSYPTADGTSGQFLSTDGSGNLTFASVPAGVGGANGVDFNDSVKARFGTGNDLEIFHDGTNGIIKQDALTGLEIMADNFRVQNSAGTETMIAADGDGAVSLYHNDTQMVSTSANGLSFADNKKATFGDSADLEIYHDGTNSFIKDVGTGGLFLRGDTVLSLGVGSESAVRCTINSDVKLYFDDAEKLATTSGGISVTGAITASGNITAYSDERLKTDIKTIDNALDKVSQMRGVTFTKDDKKGSGVIAEEMEQVAPELVMDGEYKSVAYGNIVGYLIEAIKELKTELKELKGSV